MPMPPTNAPDEYRASRGPQPITIPVDRRAIVRFPNAPEPSVKHVIHLKCGWLVVYLDPRDGVERACFIDVDGHAKFDNICR